jgi:dienelactone hydrolase
MSVPPRRLFTRLIFKGFALLSVLFVAVLFGSLRIEHTIEVTLPAPTGPFPVGRANFDWTDPATPDTLAPVPGTKRELLVWIWYPSGSSGTMDDYQPAAFRAQAEHTRGALMGKFLTRDLSKVHAHSIRDPEVSPRERSYPVIILRGGASSEVTNYSTLAEDLASHGYIVAGVDAPYRTGLVVFPDGRVMTRTPANNPELCAPRCIDKLMNAWTSDIGFALDRLEQLNGAGKFAGRLDMTRVGVFGHSFGGAQAAQFCHDDSRCKAGIDLDGQPFGSVIQEGLKQPFLFVLTDHGDASDPVSRQILANIQSIYDRLPPQGRLRLAIRGANHFLFSDDGALLKSHIVMRTLRLFGLIGIDGRRQLAVTAYCVHTFFDAHLKGDGPSRLSLDSALYPEIQVLK